MYALGRSRYRFMVGSLPTLAGSLVRFSGIGS
jgi:hypothetical protein